jgi:hypothetical protein
VNYKKYRHLVDSETIREQNKERQRRYRMSRPVTVGHEDVTPSNAASLQAEAEAEAEAEASKHHTNLRERDASRPTLSQKFIKPTLEEVTAYCNERRDGVNPSTFLDHYDSNGWKVGKNPMKDWKAAVRTWEKNDRRTNTQGKMARAAEALRKYNDAHSGSSAGALPHVGPPARLRTERG